MNLSTQHDLTRSEIIDRFRSRIEKGERTRLTRDERDTLALILVDRLIALNEQGKDTQKAIERVCTVERALLEEGFPQTSINSTYLPTYTRLVKEAIESNRLKLTDKNSFSKDWTKRDGSGSGTAQVHYALKFLTYDLATQSQLRSATTAANNKRQDDLKPVRVHEYLMKVKELLSSNDAELLTIAIGALTGRRFTEIVSVGTFTKTDHPYLIHFEGQQKKKEAQGYQILSLVEAKDLLPVIERYRALPEMRQLAGLDDEAPRIEAFNTRVNRRVQSLFGETGLVPVLEGFKSVSIHRLRALWGAIAVYFFCANNQHLHRFLQNYLGHVLDKELDANNSRATDHYFHYFLVKEDGTALTARGVKLMGVGKLPEADLVAAAPASEEEAGAIALPEPVAAVEPKPALKKKAKSPKRGSIRIDGNDHDRWTKVLDGLCPDCSNQEERMSTLLSWIESNSKNTQSTQTRVLMSPAPKTEKTISDQARTLAWLTQEVESLRTQLDTLKQERDMSSSRLEATSKLEAEIAVLRAENAELKQAKTKLEAFKKMLGVESLPEQPQPLEIRVVPQKTVVPPVTAATTPRTGSAYDRAKRIFEAVKAWNAEHPDKTFALTAGLLERDFKIHRGATKQFIESNREDITNYHQSVGIHKEQSHNRQLGRDVKELKHFVNA